MPALVTGATGLIGAHIVRALLDDGQTVRALIRAASDTSAIAGLPVETRVGDVRDRPSLDRAAAGCDLVFHAAAHFEYWDTSLHELEDTALTGTENVLRAAQAAGVARVVLTSSSVVGGFSDDGTVLTETAAATADPGEAPYVVSKIAQEREALAMADALSIDLVVARPTMTVGPFATRLGPSNAIIVTYLSDPFKMTYPGGINIASAGRVGQGHVRLARAGARGEAYLLGGENLTWEQVHRLIAELSGAGGPSVRANHTVCMSAAALEEVRATLRQRHPATTMAQAKMVGRYYWYSSDRAAALGYDPGSAREALAVAVAWLAASPHVSRETRVGMRLSREAIEARRALIAAEARLRPTA